MISVSMDCTGRLWKRIGGLGKYRRVGCPRLRTDRQRLRGGQNQRPGTGDGAETLHRGVFAERVRRAVQRGCGQPLEVGDLPEQERRMRAREDAGNWERLLIQRPISL